MILSTLFSVMALTGAPQPITEQVSFVQSGKKNSINGDTTGLDVLRAGKRIRISASALKVEVAGRGKKIRI